ncbi:hypothetical protein PoB_000275600 [Plakobranchus ocellatus]|uniref:Uncharacterized protein n=1 Tax=Plakobranchus ocellatus TaxID=259542 RepID=A0AAV3XDL0_9GAST|nr:hypothetical protein PoB_000275600 [Plakobranchus ocellatus]
MEIVAQTEKIPEEANESSAFRRTDRSISNVVRFEGEAFSPKKNLICQGMTKPEKSTREFLQRHVSVRQTSVSTTKIRHLNGTHTKKLAIHLRKTYTDPEREKSLEDIKGLVWPSAPTTNNGKRYVLAWTKRCK